MNKPKDRTVEVETLSLALKNCERRYDELLRAVTDYTYTVTIENGVVVKTKHSPACISVTGFSSEEYDSQPYLWLDMIHVEDRDLVLKQTSDILSGHDSSVIEHRIYHKDGSVRWVQNTIVRRYNINNQVYAYDGLIRDITKRKRAETALQASEAELEAIIEDSAAGITVSDLNGKILRTNPAHRKIFGYSSDELKTMTFSDFTHPDDVGMHQASYDRLLSGEIDHFSMSKRFVHKDGHIVWTQVAVSLVRDKNNKPLFVVGIVEDITDRKQGELIRERILARQQALNLLQGYLLGTGELQEKLQSITDKVVDIFDADFCRIWIMRPGDLCAAGCLHGEAAGPDKCTNRERCLHLMASSGRYTHTDGGHRRVPFGCYKIGKIAAGRQTKLLSHDITQDPQIHNREWAAKIGLKSFAGYQLRDDRGETVGVLALFSKHDIGPDEDALLESLGYSTAQVIQTSMAMSKVKILSGFLPICSACKKIRDDKGYWKQIEAYLREHSEAEFTHGVCPECAEKLYPGYNLNKED
jgi:PAS domain S-box-containing protein